VSDGGVADGGAATVGHIVYALADRRWRRIEAREGATPEDLTAAFDSISAGDDDFVALSADNAWLALSTTRFGCAGNPCLALVRGDLAGGEALQSGSARILGERPIVAPGGNLVVFEAAGTHIRDLFATRRSGGSWTAPVSITGGSTFAWNHTAALNGDASRVVFDCGTEPYGAPGTAICEVGTDGNGFRVVYRPTDRSGGTASNALHHPGFTADGDIVFEADWNGEQVWRLARSSTMPVLLSGVKTNDNSPCVLPDGRIASLWLGRPGNPQGYHELKVMTADGSADFMVVTGVDVIDAHLTCGR
jgi:hypothetical protein